VKISSHTHEHSFPSQQIDNAPHKTAERSFAHLLDNRPGAITPPQAQQKHTGALGFGELGVFGRYGASAQEGPHSTTRVKGAEAAPVTQAEIRGEEGAIASSSLVLDGPQGGQVPALPAGFAMVAGPGPQEAAASLEPVAPAVVGGDDGLGAFAGALEIASMPETESSAAAGEAQRPPPAEDNKPDQNLLVLGKDNALNVIARGGDGREDYATLRSRVEETAAEFGMKISDFRFDGAASQSFIETLGGRNGSNTG
jgi:hypothetical protein